MSRYSDLTYCHRDVTGELQRHETTPMYSSLEGNGHQTATEAYRFQGLDLATRPYPAEVVARGRSLAIKYFGQASPLGTPLAGLVRADRLGVFASEVSA